MTKRAKLTFGIILLFCNLSIAQALIFLSADTSEHYAYSITHLGNGEILIPEGIGQANYTGPFYTEVITMDQQTMVFSRMLIVPLSQNLEYAINWIIKRQDGFVGLGHCRDMVTSEVDLLLVLFDSLMNPVKDSAFGLPGYYDQILDVEAKNQRILFLTKTFNNDTAIATLWELSGEANAIKAISFDHHNVVFWGSLTYNPDINKILIKIQPYDYLAILDYPDFTVDTIIEFLQWYSVIPGPYAGFLNDSTIYDASCIKNFSPVEYWRLGFTKRTVEGNLIGNFTINDTAGASELANYNSIMILSPDTIITCAMQSTDFMVGLNDPYLGLNFSNSRIVIYAHSGEGKVYWSHSFGGDLYYIPYFLLNGEDGYIYLLGTTFDWANYTPLTGYNSTTFIFKIKASGPVTSIEESIADQGRIRLMPNPTNASTTLEGLPDEFDRQDFELQIFDVSGRLQKTLITRSSGGAVQINLAGLKKGVYFIQIAVPGGKTIVKRVVKL